MSRLIHFSKPDLARGAAPPQTPALAFTCLRTQILDVTAHVVLKIEDNSFLYRTSSRALACLHVQVLVHSLTLYDYIIYNCIS